MDHQSQSGHPSAPSAWPRNLINAKYLPSLRYDTKKSNGLSALTRIQYTNRKEDAISCNCLCIYTSPFLFPHSRIIRLPACFIVIQVRWSLDLMNLLMDICWTCNHTHPFMLWAYNTISRICYAPANHIDMIRYNPMSWLHNSRQQYRINMLLKYSCRAGIICTTSSARNRSAAGCCDQPSQLLREPLHESFVRYAIHPSIPRPPTQQSSHPTPTKQRRRGAAACRTEERALKRRGNCVPNEIGTLANKGFIAWHVARTLR